MELIYVTVIGAVLGLCSGAAVFSEDVAVGGDALLLTSLTPTQTPLTSIIWTFGAKQIISYGTNNATAPGYENRITLSIFTGEMELRNVALSDSGEYNVTIIKADGEWISELSTLTVWEVISNAEVSSSAQLTAEGTPLNVTCDSSGFISRREWLKNGSPLTSSENIVFYNEKQVLSFRTLGRKDSGRYTCNISNPVSSQEATYYMVVAYGPDSVETSGPKEVPVKTGFKLSCFAEAVPAASYIWIKNHTTVAESSELIKNTSEYADGGEYSCLATNDVTLSTLQGTFTVLITAPKSGLSAGAIAGITIACLVVVVGAAVGGVFLHKHLAQRKTRTGRPTPTPRTNNPPNTTRKNNPPNTARTNNPPNTNPPRTSTFFTNQNEPVYENSQPIYDKDL